MSPGNGVNVNQKHTKMKRVTISTSHSNFNTRPEYSGFVIDLQGGSPYFGYFWIDDICHTITKTARGYKIEKTKPPKT